MIQESTSSTGYIRASHALLPLLFVSFASVVVKNSSLFVWFVVKILFMRLLDRWRVAVDFFPHFR
jgi:hypothetical protein